jgi:hypothetical protein
MDEEGRGLGEAQRIIDRMASGSGSDAEGVGGASSGGGAAAQRAAWEAELAAELAAGEGPVMAALEAYLRSVIGCCPAIAAGGHFVRHFGPPPRLPTLLAQHDFAPFSPTPVGASLTACHGNFFSIRPAPQVLRCAASHPSMRYHQPPCLDARGDACWGAQQKLLHPLTSS